MGVKNCTSCQCCCTGTIVHNQCPDIAATLLGSIMAESGLRGDFGDAFSLPSIFHSFPLVVTIFHWQVTFILTLTAPIFFTRILLKTIAEKFRCSCHFICCDAEDGAIFSIFSEPICQIFAFFHSQLIFPLPTLISPLSSNINGRSYYRPSLFLFLQVAFFHYAVT